MDQHKHPLDIQDSRATHLGTYPHEGSASLRPWAGGVGASEAFSSSTRDSNLQSGLKLTDGSYRREHQSSERSSNLSGGIAAGAEPRALRGAGGPQIILLSTQGERRHCEQLFPDIGYKLGWSGANWAILPTPPLCFLGTEMTFSYKFLLFLEMPGG